MKARIAYPKILLEGLAVLVGVLLAFWVESIGQVREDRQRAEQYLSAFATELEATSMRVDSLIEVGEEELADIDTFFAAVVLPPAGVTPSIEDVTLMISTIAPYWMHPYQRAALDDLLSSGGLPLVEDESVRQGILSYSRLLESEASVQQNAVAFWNDHLSPYYFEHASLSGFLVTDRLGLDSPPPSIEAFVDSREFANLLGERRAIVNRLRGTRIRLKEHIAGLGRLLR
jgi:hypothetical protein